MPYKDPETRKLKKREWRKQDYKKNPDKYKKSARNNYIKNRIKILAHNKENRQKASETSS